MNNEPNHVVLDATILSTLMSCARLADFRFNHQFVPLGGKSNSLEAGSLVHHFLEHYYKALISGKSKQVAIEEGMKNARLYITGCPSCSTFKPTAEIPKPPCGHKLGEFAGVQNMPAISDSRNIGYEWALETCEQYVAHYKNDFWTPLEAEIVKGEVIYEDDEIQVLWKAKLDLIVDTNQSIQPMDHKTMKQRRESVSLNNQFMGQCILTKSRNIVINKIGFQTSLKPAEKFERSMISYSADRLFEWSQEIVPYYAKLLVHYSQSGHWPPNFTHCESKYGVCNFKDVCEADRNMRVEVLRNGFEVGQVWDIQND